MAILIWKRLTFAWLAVLTVINVYRAVTWSITIDEARVYLEFIDSPFKSLFDHYDACYHVLHTWLSRLSVGMLGRGEWVIRLPSLIAALFYFGAVWRLSRRLLGDGWQFLAAVVVLTANPLILDHMSLARGYGLALALFAWAFCHLLDAASDRDPQRINAAGYLLGLSVAANLTFAVAAVALGICFVAVWTKRQGWQPGALIDRLVLRAIVPAGLIVMIPLTKVGAGAFYFGSDTLASGLNTIAVPTLMAADPARPAWVYYSELWVFTPLAILLAVLAVAAWRKIEDEGAGALFFAGGSMILLFAMWIAAHRLFRTPYPYTRTGLGVLWLALVALVAATRSSIWPQSLRGAKWVMTAIMLALGLRGAMLVNSKLYIEFPEDAEVKQAVREIRGLHGAAPTKTCIGASWEFESDLNYYRARYRLRWMEKVTRHNLKPGCDYYVLRPADAEWIEKLQLRPAWTGPKTGIIVATPVAPRSAPA